MKSFFVFLASTEAVSGVYFQPLSTKPAAGQTVHRKRKPLNYSDFTH
jgi:hypothetical protein